MSWFKTEPCDRGVGVLRRTGSRVALSVGVVAMAAALAGLSTWASFTDSTSATHSVSTGTVEIDLGAAGTADNRLDVDVGNMAPGDSAERAVTLLNTSSLPLQQLTLTTTATPSSVLDSDPTDGLQIVIERCTNPWTETPLGGGGYTYTCSGTTTSVLASRPFIMAGQTLSALSLGAGGGTAHLRVTSTLPSTAGNAFQGATSELDLTFTATQRNATNR